MWLSKHVCWHILETFRPKLFPRTHANSVKFSTKILPSFLAGISRFRKISKQQCKEIDIRRKDPGNISSIIWHCTRQVNTDRQNGNFGILSKSWSEGRRCLFVKKTCQVKTLCSSLYRVKGAALETFSLKYFVHWAKRRTNKRSWNKLLWHSFF